MERPRGGRRARQGSLERPLRNVGGVPPPEPPVFFFGPGPAGTMGRSGRFGGQALRMGLAVLRNGGGACRPPNPPAFFSGRARPGIYGPVRAVRWPGARPESKVFRIWRGSGRPRALKYPQTWEPKCPEPGSQIFQNLGSNLFLKKT